jgi:hypothetical protein
MMFQGMMCSNKDYKSGLLMRTANSIRVACMLFVACWLLNSGIAAAQVITATIQGVVTDSSGARIPDASITVINVETNVTTYMGKSDQEGGFHATQLPVGVYKLKVKSPSFADVEVPRIAANIDQTIDETIRMVPSSATVSVVVTDENTVYLNKSDATVSTLIDPAQVDDLPVQNKNLLNLLALVPGASYGGPANKINSAQLSINGSRTLNTEVLLNGMSVVDSITGGIMTLPVPDATQEFRVLTSSASAQYGRTSGATISILTRAGTEKFHGFAYHLFRNEDMDANNYFSNLNGKPRSPDRYNELGFGLGGPIRIPFTHRAVRNAFFFYSFDDTITKSPNTVTQTVMTPDLRSGNFSGSSTPIYDPLTKKQFPGNIIPDGRIDPAAAAILKVLPLPNASTTGYNYFSAQSPENRYSKNVGRIDLGLGQNVRLFGLVHQFNSSTGALVVFNNLLNTNAGTAYAPGYEVVTGYTHVLKPSLISDIRFGYVRGIQAAQPTSLGANVRQTLGIQSLPLDITPYMNISGYGSMGTTNSQVKTNTNNTYGLTGSLTKIYRQHTIISGAQLRKNQYNAYSPFYFYNGQIAFNGEMTNQKGTANQTVNAAADFLLGLIKTAQYEIPQPETGRRNYNLAFFTQDDWKIRPDLTINLGLRWEYEAPMTVTNNIYSQFDPGTGTLLVAGKNASNSLNVVASKKNLGPRVGLAYSPRPNMVVRSGFAIFYGQLMSNLGSSIAYPGYDVVTGFNNLGTQVPQPFRLYQGIPLTGVQDLNNPAAILATGSPSTPINPAGPGFVKVDPMSADYQWNFGVQQQIDAKSIIDLNYIGDRGIHLPLFLHGNLPDMSQATQIAYANTTVALQNARPFPNIGAMQNLYQVGESSYHSLQAVARRQATPGLAFLATYTWAKAIDDGSGIYNYSLPGGLGTSQFPSIPALRKLERSVGAFDRRNTATVAIQYVTSGLRWLRDFHISPLFVARGGLPLTITQTNLFPGIDSQRPNGDSSTLTLVKPHVVGNTVQYLAPVGDPTFTLTPSGPLFVGSGSARKQILPAGIGNLPRNSVRAPGELNLNLSISRTVPIHEKVQFQFRVDAFNLLNTVNLGSPNVSLPVTANTSNQPVFNAPNFGQISTALDARTLQLQAKISF